MSFVNSYKNYYQNLSTWVSYRLAKEPRSMWDVVLLPLVPFQSQTFDAFSTSFWPYFNAISVDFYAV